MLFDYTPKERAIAYGPESERPYWLYARTLRSGDLYTEIYEFTAHVIMKYGTPTWK
jgi:hypothetical protein